MSVEVKSRWHLYSECTRTDHDSDEEDRPYSDVCKSWTPEEASSKTIADQQSEAFRRFCDRNRDNLRNIGQLVDHCTRFNVQVGGTTMEVPHRLDETRGSYED